MKTLFKTLLKSIKTPEIEDSSLEGRGKRIPTGKSKQVNDLKITSLYLAKVFAMVILLQLCKLSLLIPDILEYP
jgi:hypothetical protein